MRRDRWIGRRLFISGLATIGVLAVSSGGPEPLPAVPCATETIGIDTSLADGWDLIFDGRAFGQVFLAHDTLVKSVTVWRPANQGGNATPLRLYVTETRANPYGFGLQPDTDSILVTGDTATAFPMTDHHYPLRWEFDPPVSLPRRGHFAFAVKAEGPSCRGALNLLVDSLQTYEDGGAWRISPSALCTLGPGVSLKPWDLVFTLEFCATPVQTRPHSWGRVKAIYR